MVLVAVQLVDLSGHKWRLPYAPVLTLSFSFRFYFKGLADTILYYIYSIFRGQH